MITALVPNSHTSASAFINPTAGFCRKLVVAVQDLKTRLQTQLELTHPGSRQLIRQAVADAERLAWQTPFPHLFLPDLVEVRLAEIEAGREPAAARWA